MCGLEPRELELYVIDLSAGFHRARWSIPSLLDGSLVLAHVGMVFSHYLHWYDNKLDNVRQPRMHSKLFLSAILLRYNGY